MFWSGSLKKKVKPVQENVAETTMDPGDTFFVDIGSLGGVYSGLDVFVVGRRTAVAAVGDLGMWLEMTVEWSLVDRFCRWSVLGKLEV